MEHRQHHYQQQHNEHTIESNATGAMSFEEYDTIEQQQVQDKPNQEDSIFDCHGLYNQQQRQNVKDSMTLSINNQGVHVHYHQQNHRQHAMDKNMQHNRLLEQSDGTQQYYAPTRYDHGESEGGRCFDNMILCLLAKD